MSGLVLRVYRTTTDCRRCGCERVVVVSCLCGCLWVRVGARCQGIGKSERKLEFCLRFASYSTTPAREDTVEVGGDDAATPSAREGMRTSALVVTEQCDIQTFLKWAWVVFQLDVLQVRATFWARFSARGMWCHPCSVHWLLRCITLRGVVGVKPNAM